MTRSSSATTILVTGATGFIGTHLCNRLEVEGYVVRRALRHPNQDDDVLIGELSPEIDWSEALNGVDYVIHLAAIAHINISKNDNATNTYRRANAEATLTLAQQAANAGAKRFIFLSSIKVNGDHTEPGNPFFADTPARPKDAYALSKWEAEQGLFKLAETSHMEIVCIRPPLVYGAGVKANFHNMMRWLYRGVPMPFGGVYNKRSLVGVNNLVDLIVTCITHPAAANQVFLVSDDEDLSTTELLRSTANALGVTARFIPLPSGWLRRLAYLIGKRDMVLRLFDSLQVNIDKTKELLGWSPPFRVDDELTKTAISFLHDMKNETSGAME